MQGLGEPRGPMTGLQRRLLERVLESPQFKHAPSLRRILQYMSERTGEASPASLKE